MKKLMKKLMLIVASVLLALSVTACGEKVVPMDTDDDKEITEGVTQDNMSKANEVSEEIIDLKSYFDSAEGCAVIFDFENTKYYIYNRPLAEKQVSPCSTFKIISTLMGLKYDVLDNENSTMGYDGEEYPVADWNVDMTLENAFQSSCIWYFRKVIDKIGQDTVKNELEDLQYGNCDISEWKGSGVNSGDSLNGFWLESSLKISPWNQVEVLSEIFEGQTAYSVKDVALLKNIMQVKDDKAEGMKVYGKTGTGTNGNAWFVGFAEKNAKRFYYAVYIENSQKDTSGSVAKEISINILQDFMKE